MSLKLWIRPLTTEETKYIIEKQFGGKDIFMSPISIMGPENHTYINALNVEVTSHRVYVGDSQYIDEAVWRYADPTSGRRIPVTWSQHSTYSYLKNEAEEVGIKILTKPNDFDVLYVPTNYEKMIAEGFSYVDKALNQWHQEQSLISKWFGSMQPDYDSLDAKKIRNRLRKILLLEKD